MKKTRSIYDEPFVVSHEDRLKGQLERGHKPIIAPETFLTIQQKRLLRGMAPADRLQMLRKIELNLN